MLFQTLALTLMLLNPTHESGESRVVAHNRIEASLPTDAVHWSGLPGRAVAFHAGTGLLAVVGGSGTLDCPDVLWGQIVDPRNPRAVRTNRVVFPDLVDCGAADQDAEVAAAFVSWTRRLAQRGFTALQTHAVPRDADGNPLGLRAFALGPDLVLIEGWRWASDGPDADGTDLGGGVSRLVPSPMPRPATGSLAGRRSRSR